MHSKKRNDKLENIRGQFSSLFYGEYWSAEKMRKSLDAYTIGWE